jgi:hypothetical protein
MQLINDLRPRIKDNHPKPLLLLRRGEIALNAWQEKSGRPA